MASLLWADVDSGLEAAFDDLAEDLLRSRQDAVATVSDLYGHMSSESVL